MEEKSGEDGEEDELGLAGEIQLKMDHALKKFKKQRRAQMGKNYKKLKRLHHRQSRSVVAKQKQIKLKPIIKCQKVEKSTTDRKKTLVKIIYYQETLWCTTTIIPLRHNTQPLPTYISYLTLQNRVAVNDEKHLRFIPYIGDENELEIDMALYDAEDQKADSDFSETDEVKISIIDDYPEERQNEVWSEIEKILNVSQETLRTRVPGYQQALGKLSNNQKESLKTNGFDTRPNGAMETFETLWCGQCRVYDCSLHGGFKHMQRPLPQPPELEEDPDPYGYVLEERETTPELVPPNLPSHAFSTLLLPKYAKKEMKKVVAVENDEEKPCSPECYRKIKNNRAVADCHWDEIEISSLQRLAAVMGKNSCQISSCVGTKTCEQVFARLETMLENYEDTLTPEKRKHKEEFIEQRKKRKKGKKERKKNQMFHDESTIPAQYTPCHHPGLACAQPHCSCVNRNINCEIYCACTQDCPIQWRGCRCGTGRCRTRACPCFVAMRECNPDLCIGCQAHIPEPIHSDSINGVETTKIDGLEVDSTRLCCNVNLTHRRGKRIVLCKSKIHGFGAIAGERIRKHAYITEYMGELISQEEADRRGKLYDQQNLSYLFNLNQDYVIDAARKGNKMKFVNHSTDPNAYVRVVQVNGSHHVALFANKEIKCGQELTFDYKHDTLAEVPDWFRGRRT